MTARVALAACLAIFVSQAGEPMPGPDMPGLKTRPTEEQKTRPTYEPKLAVPESLEPFLKQVEPGNDAFPMEAHVKAIDGRLRELSAALGGGRARIGGATKSLLDPGFLGARLLPAGEPAAGRAAFDVQRAKDLPRDLTLDAASLPAELQRLTSDLRDVTVAELLMTAIEPDGPAGAPLRVRTTVRYDIVGAGTDAYRVEHVGDWEMRWRQNPSGWQVTEWSALSHVVSRARTPVFTEITEAALGRNDSFQRQLNIDLDSWMGTFDSVLTRDSNGHHGVSVGEADGDGLDDIYVAQPAGLPKPAVSQPWRLHLRGHHGAGWRRRARRHGVIALRGRRQRRP